MATDQLRSAVPRFDAGPAIGAGHALRCISLAEALIDNGWRCAFTTNSGLANYLPVASPGLSTWSRRRPERRGAPKNCAAAFMISYARQPGARCASIWSSATVLRRLLSRFKRRPRSNGAELRRLRCASRYGPCQTRHSTPWSIQKMLPRSRCLRRPVSFALTSVGRLRRAAPSAHY